MGVRSDHPARLRAEAGFTLVEVLIVMIVIGILAGISIPLFLGQSAKAQDAGAKSNLKQVVFMVEECKLEQSSYSACDEASELGGAPGINWGEDPGQAGVSSGSGSSSYSAYAVSTASTSGSSHIFIWKRNDDDTVLRMCTTDDPPHTGGGCRDATW